MDNAAPEQKAAETPEASPAPASKPPSNAVLILGFIIIALLGALIFSLISQPASDELDTAPLSGPGESATEIATRLREDANTLAAMVGDLNQRLLAQDAIITERNRETVLALEEQKRLRDENAGLRSDLNRALGDAALAQTLKRDLDNANATLASLREEMAGLEAEPGELRRQLMEADRLRRELEARVAQLESQLNQSRLFAGTESEIMKEAIELFRALRDLEGKSDSEIATAYSTFGARLGANVLKTCNFPTGSSDVPVELESGIRDLTREIPNGAMIFVVGYASETGNVDNNRRLSSDRATAVARILDSTKQPGQNVQAAYLGQTDRFSSRIPERNQIVEVWQIVSKSGAANPTGASVPPPPLPGSLR